MIAFTAGTATVVYLNFGGIQADYAVTLLVVGCLVTLAGQLVTTRLVRALGRRSIIVFMMGLLMAVASGAACFQALRSLAAAQGTRGAMWAWGSICERA